MHKTQHTLQARFHALKTQLTEAAVQPEPVELPEGFQHMTIAELNRWIEARRANV